MLVVLGHAGQPFLGLKPSLGDPGWVQILAYVANALGAIRMPAFFLLAGMAAWRGLGTDGVKSYVAKRSVRLGVPLAFVLMIINPLEVWVRIRHGELLGLAYQPGLVEGSIPGILDGTAVLHLWFIQALFYATVLSPLLAGAVARMGREAKCVVAVSLLLIGSGAQLSSWHLDLAFRAYGGHEWLTPSQLLLAIRFLMIGMILSSDPTLLVWLLGRVRASVTLLFVAAAVAVATTGSKASGDIVLHTLAMSMLPITSVVMLSAMFHRKPRWHHPFAALDASGYTIYLLHPLIVVVTTVVLKIWLGHGLPTFFLTFFIGLTVPLLLDLYVVRRSGVFAFLINGVLTSNGRRDRSVEQGALLVNARHSVS